MERILVWDLPVRFLHWVLAALFVVSFALATVAGEKSAAFGLHAVLGTLAVSVVALRLLWGLVGSRTARFGAFSFRPSALFAYLRAALGLGPRTAHDGHNPASSWFAIALFAGLLGLGVTGFLRGRGVERFEDLHEALAWGVAGLSVLHVAGIVWHRVRTRENLAWSMVSGKRAGLPGDAIPDSRRGSAAALVLITAAWTAAVFAGYDPATRRLTVPLAGTTLTIGEEGEKAADGASKTERKRDDHHDEDD